MPSVSSLTGAMVTTVAPKNGLHLTLEDVQAYAVLDDDVHSCPTRVISLESRISLPLGHAFSLSPLCMLTPA